MHIKDVYCIKSGKKWVKESQETESTLIQEYKPEQLTDIKCFVWKYFNTDAPKLNAPPADKIKVIEEELNTLNSAYPKVSVFVKSTNSQIVQYVQFTATLSEVRAKVFEMDQALDQSKTFYFRNFGKIVHDEK